MRPRKTKTSNNQFLMAVNREKMGMKEPRESKKEDLMDKKKGMKEPGK